MESIVIRRSPVVIIRDLIILQICVTVFYFVAAIVGNYGEIFQELSFTKLLSYELAKSLFIGIGESLIIALIFLRWFFHDYTIYPNMIIEEKGMVFKKRMTFNLPPETIINCHYSSLARLFRYGRLVFHKPDGEIIKIISPVPEAAVYYTKIKQLLVRVSAPDKTSVEDLLKNNEQQKLEFKASFRWDLKENKLNKNLEKAVLKTVAAFLNSDGGHLLVGVGDQKEVIGLANDYHSLNKKDADGFENHFTNIFKTMIGAEFRRFLNLSFHQVSDKEICWIKVVPSTKPAYAKFDNDEFFFVRTGNSTTALPLSETADYIHSRFV